MLPRLLLRGRNFVSACLIRLDVRFWHKADMLNALTNVRFWGQSGHGPTAAPLLPLTPRMLRKGRDPDR